MSKTNFLPALNVAASQRPGVFKVKVYSNDNSFLGETEIEYLDLIDEVLAQAMKSRAIMRKFLAVLYRSLQEDSEGIIGNTQGSSKFGMLTLSGVHFLYDVHCHMTL